MFLTFFSKVYFQQNDQTYFQLIFAFDNPKIEFPIIYYNIYIYIYINIIFTSVKGIFNVRLFKMRMLYCSVKKYAILFFFIENLMDFNEERLHEATLNPHTDVLIFPDFQ